MMTPSVAYLSAAILLTAAAFRAIEAGRVLRYQRNLRQLPTYSLSAEKIPVSQHKLFLGRGFRWTQKHTQRLRDTIRPAVQSYVEPGLLHRWARRKEVEWEQTFLLKYLAWFLRTRAWWNPPCPPAAGGWQATVACSGTQ